MNFALTLALILLGTTLFGHLAARMGQPAVIGQLLVGILLGPSLLGWVPMTGTMTHLAELGVVWLMFLAGLETDRAGLKRYLGPSVAVASLGVLVPVAVTYLISRAWHLSVMTSLFTGIVFAATSVSISVAVLRELGALTGRVGSIILGAAVIDDVVAVLATGAIMSLQGGGALGVQLVGQLGFVAVVLVLMKGGTSWLLHLAARLKMPQAELVVAGALALGLAGLAEVVGLSDALGAFFAGLAVGLTAERNPVTRAVDTVGSMLLVPIFFVSIGLQVHLSGQTDWLFVLVLTVLAVLTKWVGAGVGAWMFKSSWQDASVIGAGMVSRGEMALIVAALGKQAGLLPPATYQVVVAAVILATLIAPVLLRWTLSLKQPEG